VIQLRSSTLVRLRGNGAIWSMRWHVARAIAVHEIRDALVGWAFYLTATIATLLSALFVYNSLNFVDNSGLQILARPFFVPALITTTLAALYMAAWATLAIARPRDQGALRVLFFAPVDAYGVMIGHVLAGTALYALLVVVTTPLLALIGLFTNLPLPPLLLLALLSSPVYAAAAVALGLCISAVAASSRSAMFVLGAALIAALAIPAAYTALLGVPATSRYYDALLFLRGVLRTLRDILGWISPFALIASGMEATVRAGWLDTLLRLGAAAAGCVAWSCLAIWGLEKRGVL
jgi:hypothetical protein